MTAHIERKIRRDFAPYLVTAREHHKWPPYWIYVGYSYVGELAMLLAGLGLATPLSALATGTPGTDTAGVAGQLGGVSIVILVAWLTVKIYVQRQNLEKRCSLLTSYRKQCRDLERELELALDQEDPMPDLLRVQSKLRDLVNRSAAEEAIRHNGVDERLETQFDRFSSRLIHAYADNWRVQPGSQRRRRVKEAA